MRFTRPSPARLAVDSEADLTGRRRRMGCFLVGIAALCLVVLLSWLSRVHGYALVIGQEVAIRPSVDGRVVEILHEGTAVRMGDLLARLDDSIRALRLREADATIAQVRTEIAVERAARQDSMAGLLVRRHEVQVKLAQAGQDLAVSEATNTYDQVMDRAHAALLTEEAVDVQDRELAKRNRASSEAGVKHGRQVLDERRAELAELNRQIRAQQALVDQVDRLAEARLAAQEASRALRAGELDATRLLSPLNGRVSRLYGPVGTFMEAGKVVMTVIDPKDLWVGVFVDEQLLGDGGLDVGQVVDVSLDAYPFRTFRGRVVQSYSRLSTRPLLAPGDVDAYEVDEKMDQVLAAKIRFAGSARDRPTDLRPGMTGTVLLQRRGPLSLLRTWLDGLMRIVR